MGGRCDGTAGEDALQSIPWRTHDWLADPTLTDAILDRIVHGAHKIALRCESMRRKQLKP
jgi:hypothetical protein